MSDLKTNVLGYPRVGEKREWKSAVESFWRGQITEDELNEVGAELRKAHWLKQKDAGIDLIPCNDFSSYDHVLDMSCLLGNLPSRFGAVKETVSLKQLFEVARGSDSQPAAEMTKWFDTNYHYIVPEFHRDTVFKVSFCKVFDEFEEAKALGIITKPVLLGPLSYLFLGKVKGDEFDRYELLDQLVGVYVEILRRLVDQGAEWIQLDEPIFSLNLTEWQKECLQSAYCKIAEAVPNVKILVANYFGELRDNLNDFFSLPVEAYHVDAVAGRNEMEEVAAAVPEGKILSVGIVNGRNVWKNNYSDSFSVLVPIRKVLGDERLMISASCSFLHSPYSLRYETQLDDELKGWLSFAEEKLNEVHFIREFLLWKAPVDEFEMNRDAHVQRSKSPRIHNQLVKDKVKSLRPDDLKRWLEFSARQKKQREKLKLPLFPTTTIGSFPQTKEVRQARAKWRRGSLPDAEYEAFLQSELKECIAFQENCGLDMLVHGEFERTDMVEFFGEKLDGFAFTQNGWVQSYGSRCVKPPIIYADVYRAEPMTVKNSAYAQSLTDKPVKGMLTGPITILQWSFVRDDQERSTTAKQIALAIRAEVMDLEAAGLPAIQIDEPALREGLPLRKEDHKAYLRWAVDAFRLSAAGVNDETQIHTHMCYCEFNDIIESIAELDADVITIETSRSNMELLGAFSDFSYPNEIGPGVYDIHSPRIPDQSEITRLMQKAVEVIPLENVWVNPDCGLKTRTWDEVKPALTTLVKSAKQLREQYSPVLV